jgi:hypothetical protein
VKSSSKLEGLQEILSDLRLGEGSGTSCVGVKSFNPRRTTCGEGGCLEQV